MKIQSKNKEGFTLIEMMIVVAIIGILAVVALAAVNQLRRRSTATQVKQTATELITALESATLDGETSLSVTTMDTTDGEVDVTGINTGNVYIPKFNIPAGCRGPNGCVLTITGTASTGQYDFAIGPLKNNNVWRCTVDSGCFCAKSDGTDLANDAACNSA